MSILGTSYIVQSAGYLCIQLHFRSLPISFRHKSLAGPSRIYFTFFKSLEDSLKVKTAWTPSFYLSSERSERHFSVQLIWSQAFDLFSQQSFPCPQRFWIKVFVFSYFFSQRTPLVHNVYLKHSCQHIIKGNSLNDASTTCWKQITTLSQMNRHCQLTGAPNCKGLILERRKNLSVSKANSKMLGRVTCFVTFVS